MEIDKKIIKRLIDVLEDLKKNLNQGGEQINFHPHFRSKIGIVQKYHENPLLGTKACRWHIYAPSKAKIMF